jgi:hypothetical protein
MSQQQSRAAKSLRGISGFLVCVLLNLQGLPSHAETRLCNAEERQVRLQLINQLRGADETYEGNRTNYFALKSGLPEERAKLVPIQKKFEENESKYSALLKEVKRLEPGFIRAEQRWNSYNAKLGPALSRFDVLIGEFNRLATEFKKQKDIKEYQLNIALKYGDSIRADKIRSDILAIAADIGLANQNINSLTRSRNSIYSTATYKMESKAFNSVANVFNPKKVKLDSLGAIRQQYFLARANLREIEMQVFNGPKNLRILNSERYQLFVSWVKMEAICQLEVTP